MNEKINQDLVLFMKKQDKLSLSVLRMLKSALQLEKINKKEELSDEDVIMVIKRQVKMRKDSIIEFTKYNKKEEIDTLNKEIEILEKYLPKQMNEEEIDKKIDEVFSMVNPSSIKDMGIIMKDLNSISSSADMSLVSKKVKEKLTKL